jgi:predicted phage terminase large subunit-like protein
MQRLHEDDLSGHIIENEIKGHGTDEPKKDGSAIPAARWVHLCLPMRGEPNRMATTPLGWLDWREPGELLWPGAFSEVKVAELETEMGSLRAAGQLAQRPVPLGGQIFHEEWFEIVDTAPVKLREVRYWDNAGTKGGGAYTAGVRMGIDQDGEVYVVDVRRAQVAAHARLQLQKNTAKEDADNTGNTIEIWAEQEPGSAGKDVAAIFVKQLRGYPVYVQRPTGDKVTRAMPFAAQCEAGNVKLVRGPWNRAYIDELTSFPNGRYKDQTDGSSGAYNKLVAPGRPALAIDDIIASGDPEHAAEEHRPFSDAEIEQLPDFIKGLVESSREVAKEKNDEDNFGWNS